MVVALLPTEDWALYWLDYWSVAIGCRKLGIPFRPCPRWERVDWLLLWYKPGATCPTEE